MTLNQKITIQYNKVVKIQHKLDKEQSKLDTLEYKLSLRGMKKWLKENRIDLK